MTNMETILTTLQLEGNEETLSYFLEGKLLTFAEWKKRGYIVQKGQKATVQVPIWRKVKNKKDEKKFIRRTASFFTPKQVKELVKA